MKKYILLAGAGFYLATFVTVVLLAWTDPQTTEHYVTNVVTGERVPVFHWDGLSKFREAEFLQLFTAQRAGDVVATNNAHTSRLQSWGAYVGALHNITFDKDAVANSMNLEQGMEVYKKSVCWHCHSQFVRPLEYENRRWGPTAQIGEASWENPHMFATRRVGPDLLREGGLRPDDWHYAHFFNPKFTVPQSIMAPFGYMGEYFIQLPAADRDAIEGEIADALVADRNSTKKVFAGAAADAEGNMFEFLREQDEAYRNRAWILFKGRSDPLSHNAFPVVRIAPRPTQDMINLVAYVQSRGTSIGTTKEWADVFTKWSVNKDDEALRREFLKLGRKKNFQVGNWRIQPGVSRPTGEPDYVMAPAIAELLKDGLEREETSIRDENGGMVPAELGRQRVRNWHESVKRGADLFGKKCVGCHGGLDDQLGEDRFTETLRLSLDRDYLEPREQGKFDMIGNGFGPAARFLAPEPRNLTLNTPVGPDGRTLNIGYYKLYKYRSTTAVLPLPRDIFHTIRNGMMPSSMPSWPFLTDWEVWDLVNFVMYIGKDQTTRAGAEAGGVSPYDGGVRDFWELKAVRESHELRIPIPAVPTKDEAGVVVDTPYLEKRGEELFKGTRALPGALGKTQCLNCHGADADGWGEQRAEVINKLGFAPRNIWMGQFKMGSSPEDIYITLRNGIAGTPMGAQVLPGWTDLDAWSLVYYVRKLARLGVTNIGNN
ncbi:MAG: cbb3-type cytochrome c oxidase subunit II [Planctomycetes bacterium]|nr:cbb3-type cytochrome c oxidase subunit II [Planctomycetota bacterium]